MIKLKEFLPLINIIALVGLGIFIFMNCNLSRSPLIYDDKYPYSCKTILDDSYLKQNNEGAQSSLSAMIGESCKGSLTYVFCADFVKVNYPDESLSTRKAEFILCLAKHGK